jgi:hypothetical protein
MSTASFAKKPTTFPGTLPNLLLAYTITRII